MLISASETKKAAQRAAFARIPTKNAVSYFGVVEVDVDAGGAIAPLDAGAMLPFDIEPPGIELLEPFDIEPPGIEPLEPFDIEPLEPFDIEPLGIDPPDAGIAPAGAAPSLACCKLWAFNLAVAESPSDMLPLDILPILPLCIMP